MYWFVKTPASATFAIINHSSFGDTYDFPFFELLNCEILSTIMVFVIYFRKKPAKKGKGAKAASEKKEKKKPVTAAAAKVGVNTLCMKPSSFALNSNRHSLCKDSFIAQQILSGDSDKGGVHEGEKRLNLSLLFTCSGLPHVGGDENFLQVRELSGNFVRYQEILAIWLM